MAKTRIVSYSTVDTYRQCRLKWRLGYVENWQKNDEAPALTRGTLWHSMMEAHYGLLQQARRARLEVTAAALFDVVKPLLYDERTGAQNEHQEICEWMYRGYIEQYGLDPYWEIVAIEMPFQAWLPTERGGRSNFKLAGTVDLLLRDHQKGGGLWIVDHKTCKDLPRQKDFDMEDQTGIYAYLLRRAGYDIRGAIYGHSRTKKLVRPMDLSERFRRTTTVRQDEELRTMALEVLGLMREAYRNYGGDALQDPPRTPDGERCGWKCSFTEPCLAGRKSGPATTRALLQEFGFHRGEHPPGPTFTRLAKEATKRA